MAREKSTHSRRWNDQLLRDEYGIGLCHVESVIFGRTPRNVRDLASKLAADYPPGEVPCQLVQEIRKAITNLNIKQQDVAFAKVIEILSSQPGIQPQVTLFIVTICTDMHYTESPW